MRDVQGYVWETVAENQGCATGIGTGVAGSRIAVSLAHTAAEGVDVLRILAVDAVLLDLVAKGFAAPGDRVVVRGRRKSP